jgi:hypothetical protein
MKTILINVERLVADDASYAVIGVLVVAMFLWLPFAEAKSALLVIAVLVGALIFLLHDVRGLRLEPGNAGAVMAYCCFLIGCLWLGTIAAPQLVSATSSRVHLLSVAFAVTFWSQAIVEELAHRRYLLTPLQRNLVRNWDMFVFALMIMFAHGFISFSLFLAGVAYGLLGTCLVSVHAALLAHLASSIAADRLGLSSMDAVGGSSALAEVVVIVLLLIFTGVGTLSRRG